MIGGEPYFKYWRIFVIESWSPDTVTIEWGEFYGREDGPNLLDSAIDGFASDGFPSFNGWTADLSPDGTAYVGAEWMYPIAPRAFELVATTADNPKRFRLECSNNKREWFQFGLDYELPEGSGGGGDPVYCELITGYPIEIDYDDGDFGFGNTDGGLYSGEGCSPIFISSHALDSSSFELRIIDGNEAQINVVLFRNGLLLASVENVTAASFTGTIISEGDIQISDDLVVGVTAYEDGTEFQVQFRYRLILA